MYPIKMHSTRFESISSHFMPSGIRTSFRRSSSASSRASSNRNSFSSSSHGSPVSTINSVIFRQPTIVGMEAERKSYGTELDLLEPRPIVYWGGLEERMGSF